MNRTAPAMILVFATMYAGVVAQEDQRQSVSAFQLRRFAAMVRNDADAVAECLSDDLTYTHSGGETETKAQFLETLRTGRIHYERIEPTDVDVRLYGDVAVMTGRSTMHVRSDGELQVLSIKFIEVDRWTERHWQMVAWQSTRESAAAPTPSRSVLQTPGPGQAGSRGQGAAYRPGNGVSLPTLIREVKPQYTSEAMQAKIEGTVMLECVVAPDGSVTDVQVTRSLDAKFGLDDVAVQAAKQWKFRPGMRNGEPVPVIVTIELTFTMKKDD